MLPHDPYITTVHDALTAAGLEPRCETSDAEIDPYETGPDAGLTRMLSALLSWPASEDADGVPHDGLLLIWESPAEQWQYAEMHEDGSNAEPRFLPHLPRFAAPASVVATVRALLAGAEPPDGLHPEWAGADQARAAVTAWAQ